MGTALVLTRKWLDTAKGWLDTTKVLIGNWIGVDLVLVIYLLGTHWDLVGYQ